MNRKLFPQSSDSLNETSRVLSSVRPHNRKSEAVKTEDLFILCIAVVGSPRSSMICECSFNTSKSRSLDLLSMTQHNP